MTNIEATRREETTDQDPLDRYRRLVEQSGVGLFETAVDGRVLWINPAAARIAGYDKPEEFLSSVGNIRELYVHPDLRDEFVEKLRSEGEVSGFEYEIWHRTGAIRWISVTSRARRDERDAVLGFEGTVIDITESKLVEAATAAIASNLKPEEAVMNFARVLERVVPFRQVSLTAIEGDCYRRLVSVAGHGGQPLPPGERVPLAGNSMEWVVRTKQPLVVPDTSARRWPFDSNLAAAGVASYAILPVMVDSEVFATFNLGMPGVGDLSDDVVRLLTAQTGSAAQAVRNILLYEREREAVQRLEAVDELKNELIASVAHDLKTPLAVISGFSSVLRDLHDAPPETREEAIRGIERSVSRMSRLIRQDLTMALLEDEEMAYQVESFDLSESLREAVEDSMMFKQTHSIDIDVPPGLHVLGDRERNHQVLDNLIGNAIKFSPPGSHIEVGARRRAGEVEIWVSDEGPGIAEEDMPRLFKKMSRLHRGDHEGSGLGLFICKKIVEAQGGRISVGKSPSGGARFVYTLPAA